MFRLVRSEHGNDLRLALKARIGQLYAQLRTILRAMAHPQVPWYVKLFCGSAVLYVASPIQIIPNFIPIIGQMDDVLVIGLSIKLLKRFVPPSVLEECQNASRLSRDSEALSGLPMRSSMHLESEDSSRDSPTVVTNESGRGKLAVCMELQDGSPTLLHSLYR